MWVGRGPHTGHWSWHHLWASDGRPVKILFRFAADRNALSEDPLDDGHGNQSSIPVSRNPLQPPQPLAMTLTAVQRRVISQRHGDSGAIGDHGDWGLPKRRRPTHSHTHTQDSRLARQKSQVWSRSSCPNRAKPFFKNTIGLHFGVFWGRAEKLKK